MEKQKLYPKTIGSQVINVTDPTLSTSDKIVTNNLTTVLNNLKGSVASVEKSGEAFQSGKHIDLAGVRKSQDLSDKTALEIIKALLCPQYAPYYTQKNTSIAIGIENNNVVSKVSSNGLIRKWVGVEPTLAEIKINFTGATIQCYDNSYTKVKEHKRTIDTSTIDKVITKAVFNDRIQYTINLKSDGSTIIPVAGYSRSDIVDSYGYPTNHIADTAATLLESTPEASSAIVDHPRENGTPISDKFYLTGTTVSAAPVTITYLYPDFIYQVNVETNNGVITPVYTSFSNQVDSLTKVGGKYNALPQKVYSSTAAGSVTPVTIYALLEKELTYKAVSDVFGYSTNITTNLDRNTLYYFKPDNNGIWVPCSSSEEGAVGYHKYTQIVYDMSNPTDVSSEPLFINITQ